MFDRSHEVSASSTSSKLPANCTPTDLYNALSEDRAALLAFGELLRTARLSEFDQGMFSTALSADKVAEERQHGLARLLNLCLESQQRIIDSYLEQYQNRVHTAATPDRIGGEVAQ